MTTERGEFTLPERYPKLSIQSQVMSSEGHSFAYHQCYIYIFMFTYITKITKFAINLKGPEGAMGGTGEKKIKEEKICNYNQLNATYCK